MNTFYLKNTRRKLPIKNGLFECQNCGNRQVCEKDKHCKMCGVLFENEPYISKDDGNSR